MVDGRDSKPNLLAAAKEALFEMRHTVAPRDGFTDAVDMLDAAIVEAERATDRTAITLSPDERQAVIDAIEEVLGDSWQRRTPWHIGLLEKVLERLKSGDMPLS